MNSPIYLTRKLDVQCLHFTGTVAFATPRSCEISILQQVLSEKTISAADVWSHLSIRKPVASRLLHVLKQNRLISEQHGRYELTPPGKEAAETGLIYIPEFGTWTVWVSNDPLLPFRVLKIEPFKEPSLFDEVMNGKSHNGDRSSNTRKISKLPDWILELIEKSGTPAFNGGKSIRIDDFGKEGKGEMVDPESDLRVSLTITQDSCELRMNGQLQTQSVQAELSAPADITYEQAWLDLIAESDLKQNWDETRRALRIHFSEAEDSERSNLLRVLEFSKPELPALGSFDAMQVEKITVLPKTQSDANEWALWRLKNSITAFATTPRFEEWRKMADEPFKEFSLNLPSREALFADSSLSSTTAKPSELYWFLQAAEDFNL